MTASKGPGVDVSGMSVVDVIAARLERARERAQQPSPYSDVPHPVGQELERLMRALPRIEGTIEVRPQYPREGWSVWVDGIEHAEFATESEARTYAALLEKRRVWPI